jgi:BarA-like signal transduction histidine kinase
VKVFYLEETQYVIQTILNRFKMEVSNHNKIDSNKYLQGILKGCLLKPLEQSPIEQKIAAPHKNTLFFVNEKH